MSLVKIFENDNFIIDYDKENKKYRVSYFENNHWVDECWFDPYEEKETSLSKALKEYNFVECRMTDEEFEEFKKIVDKFNSIGCTSFQLSPQDLIEDGVDLKELKSYMD